MSWWVSTSWCNFFYRSLYEKSCQLGIWLYIYPSWENKLALLFHVFSVLTNLFALSLSAAEVVLYMKYPLVTPSIYMPHTPGWRTGRRTRRTGGRRSWCWPSWTISSTWSTSACSRWRPSWRPARASPSAAPSYRDSSTGCTAKHRRLGAVSSRSKKWRKFLLSNQFF